MMITTGDLPEAYTPEFGWYEDEIDDYDWETGQLLVGAEGTMIDHFT